MVENWVLSSLLNTIYYISNHIPICKQDIHTGQLLQIAEFWDMILSFCSYVVKISKSSFEFDDLLQNNTHANCESPFVVGSRFSNLFKWGWLKFSPKVVGFFPFR